MRVYLGGKLAAAAVVSTALVALTSSVASAYSFTGPGAPSRWGLSAMRPSSASSALSRRRRIGRGGLVMKDDGGGKSGDGDGTGEGGVGGFSLSSLFGNKEQTKSSSSSSPASSRLGSRGVSFGAGTEPHPASREHISPLNLLHPSRRSRDAASTDTGEERTKDGPPPLPVHPDVKSGVLPNGLSYVILPNRSPPGRFEAHLQVFSGSGASPVPTRNGFTREGNNPPSRQPPIAVSLSVERYAVRMAGVCVCVSREMDTEIEIFGDPSPPTSPPGRAFFAPAPV